MNKKQNERNILNLVYEEYRYAEIVESERPDFRLRHKGEDSFFGVEVTELFVSEASARLRKIPNYFNEAVFQGRYRHKTDKVVLQADEMTIIAPDGTVKAQTRGIMWKMLTPEEYAGKIADVIKLKDDRYGEYDTGLDHINLIILDTEHELALLSVNQFYEHVYTPQLREALFASAFNEIFFVTTLERDRRVYIPLKMLLLLAEYHLFGKLVMEYPWETTESDSPSDDEEDNDGVTLLMQMFSQYLRAKSDRIYTRDTDGNLEVIFGGCGMRLEDDRKVIYDHFDYPLPTDVEVVAEDAFTTFFSSDEFLEKAGAILADVTFQAEIAFDVKT